jgi:RNase H-like domain found in reverse transcriptase
MQSLLAFTIFFRQFIRNYSEAIRQLQETVKGNLDWKGRKLILQTDNLINAFERLKTIFISIENTYLYIPHQKDQLVLKADASLVASGAILLATWCLSLSEISDFSDEKLLSQENIRVCKFTSKMYNRAETRYSTIERELLSIVNGIEAFRSLIGSSGK